MIRRVQSYVKACLTIATILIAICAMRPFAFGEIGNSECHSQVWNAAQKLQPWYYRATSTEGFTRRSRALREFTDAVCTISPAHQVDPLLAVALAFRESSLLPQVGLGEKNGQRGERGYWQVMPGGKAESFVSDECSQHTPLCNAQSAFSYLAWLRERCQSDDLWVIVGAYGRGECPNQEQAREWAEVRIARRYYCDIDSLCEQRWPE